MTTTGRSPPFSLSTPFLPSLPSVLEPSSSRYVTSSMTVVAVNPSLPLNRRYRSLYQGDGGAGPSSPPSSPRTHELPNQAVKVTDSPPADLLL
ncbi:hypothetical protein Hamer_G009256 [Homarus americanus]|uniref:Uncharacterized protein n=1 Tax=Homarus americanus TaxID=6706 RepID=A0A8J5J783_HOMAM|nr:hypothetical protein Hamer_G009256 [Homarus americanus]